MEDHGAPGPQPQVPLARYLTFKLARVHARLDAQVSRLLAHHAKLSLAQWRILSLVGRNPGSTASELTVYSDMDKGLFSRKLKTLVSADLVRSAHDRTDARVARLHLTPAGEEIFERTMPHMLSRQDVLRERLGSERYDRMLEDLEILEGLAGEDL